MQPQISQVTTVKKPRDVKNMRASVHLPVSFSILKPLLSVKLASATCSITAVSALYVYLEFLVTEKIYIARRSTQKLKRTPSMGNILWLLGSGSRCYISCIPKMTTDRLQVLFLSFVLSVNIMLTWYPLNFSDKNQSLQIYFYNSSK